MQGRRNGVVDATGGGAPDGRQRAAGKRLTVRESSWHWRVFLRWERRRKRYEAFMDEASAPNSYTPFRRENLDLCRYCRIVLFWSPLRWYFQRERGFKPWWTLVAFLGLCVLYTIGFLFYEYTVGMAVLTGAAVFVAGLILLGHWVDSRKKRKKELEQFMVPKEPGLIRSYIKAKKRRICPLIEVRP